MQQVIGFVTEHSTAIIGGLLGLSELLALIPGVKANSVFQLVTGWLKKKQQQ